VRDFLRAIERRERQRRLGEAISLRMSQAEGKAWKKYVRQLEEE
jgi:hypothetical protein